MPNPNASLIARQNLLKQNFFFGSNVTVIIKLTSMGSDVKDSNGINNFHVGVERSTNNYLNKIFEISITNLFFFKTKILQT